MRFVRGGDVEHQLDLILNGGIDFSSNVKGGMVEVTTTGGEQEVMHGLPFIPNGFLVIAKEGPGDVYASRINEWDTTRLYLASSVQNLRVRLFVM